MAATAETRLVADDQYAEQRGAQFKRLASLKFCDKEDSAGFGYCLFVDIWRILDAVLASEGKGSMSIAPRITVPLSEVRQ